MPNEAKIIGFVTVVMMALCIYGCTRDQQKIASWRQECAVKGGEPMSGKGNYPYCIIDGKIVDMRYSP